MTDPVYVNQIDASLLLIQLGNGATPEVFAQPCLINTSKGFTRTANATATEIARCDDPTQPMKTVRVTTSRDSTIDGAGMLDVLTAKTYLDLVGFRVNIKVNVGNIAGALVVQGPYILTSFALTGGKLGDTVSCTLKFDQADEPTSTLHA